MSSGVALGVALTFGAALTLGAGAARAAAPVTDTALAREATRLLRAGYRLTGLAERRDWGQYERYAHGAYLLPEMTVLDLIRPSAMQVLSFDFCRTSPAETVTLAVSYDRLAPEHYDYPPHFTAFTATTSPGCAGAGRQYYGASTVTSNLAAGAVSQAWADWTDAERSGWYMVDRRVEGAAAGAEFPAAFARMFALEGPEAMYREAFEPRAYEFFAKTEPATGLFVQLSPRGAVAVLELRHGELPRWQIDMLEPVRPEGDALARLAAGGRAQSVRVQEKVKDQICADGHYEDLFRIGLARGTARFRAFRFTDSCIEIP